MKKLPKIDISQMDQAAKALTDHYIPMVASIFRKFCEEESISRIEAMELTIAYMHTPKWYSPEDRDEDKQS